MPRLFVALRPPALMRVACRAAMEDGTVERTVAEDIAAALGSIHAPAIHLALSGVGWFDQGPRGALFARAVPADPLAALHKKIDRAMVRIGLSPNAVHICPMSPSPGGDRARPTRPTGRNAMPASPAAPVSAMILVESHLGRHGSIYVAVASYPFAAA